MDNHTRDQLNKLKSIDPLAEAEKLTGRSYKEDPLTVLVGMGKNMRRSELVQAICSEHDDIHYDLGIDDCLRIIDDCGFEIFGESIKTSEYSPDARQWTLWHPAYRLLGHLESYMSCVAEGEYREKLNDLTLSGQFTAPTHAESGKYPSERRPDSDGGMHGCRFRKSDGREVLVSSWTVRDGLRRFMADLADSGLEPVDRWVKDFCYIRDHKVALLPEYVAEVVHADKEIMSWQEIKQLRKDEE